VYQRHYSIKRFPFNRKNAAARTGEENDDAPPELQALCLALGSRYPTEIFGGE
jgi:hypothetical protein